MSRQASEVEKGAGAWDAGEPEPDGGRGKEIVCAYVVDGVNCVPN
jgi:hypothetical protein